MGNAFSSLTGFLRRRRNTFGGVNCCPISNHPGDVGSRHDENEDNIQIEDRSNGDDSEIHRNQGDNSAQRDERALIELSKAITCTNNIEISNVHHVVNGDNTTINVAESDQRKNITLVYLAVRPEERNSVYEETQISTRPTVTNNITIQDSNIVAVANTVQLNLQTCHPDLEEALSLDPNRRTDLNIQKSVRVQLFPLPPQLPSVGVEPRLVKVFDIMCRIVDQLYPLRDSGEWVEFEKASLRLQTNYDRHPEIKCFLLLEESVKLTYQKSLKATKRKAEECLNIVNNEASKISGASQDVLIVLGNVASASIFRRLPKKKLGKAFKCLEEAKESGERLKSVNLTMPKFALALLDYEQARCYMAFATLTNDTKHCNRKACRMLGLCIDKRMNSKLSDESHLYTARQSFALLYLARLSLPTTKCHSQPGQCETRQAEKHLEEYHRCHRDLENFPVAARVKYFMTHSELCFLMGNFHLAKDFACRALQIAVKYGFELETVSAQIHLDQICHQYAFMAKEDKLPVVKNLPSGYSSSSTTDSDQKYTGFMAASQRAT